MLAAADPARVSGIPERVPLAARLVDEIARSEYFDGREHFAEVAIKTAAGPTALGVRVMPSAG